MNKIIFFLPALLLMAGCAALQKGNTSADTPDASPPAPPAEAATPEISVITETIPASEVHFKMA